MSESKNFLTAMFCPQATMKPRFCRIYGTILLKGAASESKDTLYLQMALRQEGLYPPENKTFNDCPLSGVFGNCTFEAVKKFQEKYADEILTENDKIEKASGFAGPKTLAKLNEIYGE